MAPLSGELEELFMWAVFVVSARLIAEGFLLGLLLLVLGFGTGHVVSLLKKWLS